ncbi:MAG: phenylalanine--tRNA ligase subunit alpha, partial [Alphaproteobacteria bacterium]|nr:phenylalanine--tRNA ligase subunit alpha [Alphaproteobacteria bacterium]
MQEKLSEIKNATLPAIQNAKTLIELDAIRVGVMGKNGSLTGLMKELGSVSIDEKKTFGAAVNTVKNEITAAIEAKKEALEEAELNAKLQSESVDVTLPCRPQNIGRIHPITQAIEETLTIFAQMGFDLAEGPDIEDDWHNFEALNIPPEHPARQMQATFFFDNKNMLRTQTSGVQIRTMENKKPPIKIVCPGRTYRRDYDATHTPMFHQIEGLVIDEKTNLANLKSVLVEFFKLFFETDDVKVRFRPSYFPFTEPSYEMDLGGVMARNIGKEWIELLGCGV